MSVGGAEISNADDQPLARGVLSTMDLPGGIRFCANDLVTLRDNEGAATVSQSLTIILALDGDPVRYSLGACGELVFHPGCAAMIAAAGDVRFTARYRRGQRRSSLVLQVNPDDMQDEALQEQVRRSLTARTVTPLPVSDRLLSLARDVFAIGHAGPVTRLLAESCALELLARGLAAGAQSPATSGAALHARDVRRILRIRDKLVSEPAEEHRLHDLARLAGMCASSLKAKFPRVVGQSVFDFLRSQRLERARRGLQHEGWTVKQAAHFVGYAHPGNFATAYRRKFGTAPRAARDA